MTTPRKIFQHHCGIVTDGSRLGREIRRIFIVSANSEPKFMYSFLHIIKKMMPRITSGPSELIDYSSRGNGVKLWSKGYEKNAQTNKDDEEYTCQRTLNKKSSWPGGKPVPLL